MPTATTVAQMQVVVSADTSPATKELGALEKSIGSTGQALSLAFGTAAVAGIAAVGAGLAAAVTSAADFEKTMSGVKAVSGATADEMKDLSSLALQLGKDTSFSASEAAAGIEELVKGGLSIPDIMNGAAEATLNLAAAGGVSLPDAATIAANALAEFNLKGSDMAHVADLIAGAANASALDVSDFKMSLQAAGAVAATVGFSFDDLAQGIAIMGKAGITGSDAGTSLKTMMMNLVPATNAASDTMRDLGIITGDTGPVLDKLRDSLSQTELGQKKLAALTKSGLINSEEELFNALDKVNPQLALGASNATDYGVKAGLLGNQFFDATGKVKSMSDVAEILKASLAGMSQEQELATLRVLFGSDAIRAAAVLAKEGADGFNEMAESMGKVTAASVGAERLNNLNGSVEQLKGSLETLGITIGMEFLPMLKDGTDAVTGLINVMIPLAEKVVPEVVTIFREDLGSVVGWFKDNWPLIQQTYHTVTGSIESDNEHLASTFTLTFGEMRGTAATRMGEIGDAIKLAMHAINGDWDLAWKDITSIADREQKIQNAQAELNAAVGQKIVDTLTQGMLTRFETDMKRLNEDVIVPGWQTINDSTKAAFDGAYGIVGTVAVGWVAVVDGTRTMLGDGANALGGVVQSSWQAIVDDTASLARSGSDLLNAAKDVGTGIVTSIRDGIDSALSGFWSWLQANFVDKIPDFVKELLDINSPSGVMYDIGRQMVEGLRLGMESKLPSIDDVIAKAVGMLGRGGDVPGELDDWLQAAIAITGVGADWLSGLRWLAMHESTGNPRAVNPQGVGGQHASGLMQTMPSTFAGYRNKDLPNDIFNPIANAVAAIGYIKATYGSIGRVISGWEARGGYAAGGWAGLHGPELAWLGERGPEYVIPNSRLGGGNGGMHQTMTLNLVVGGRVAEQIVIEGYELAARKGRLPAVAAGRLPVTP